MRLSEGKHLLIIIAVFITVVYAGVKRTSPGVVFGESGLITAAVYSADGGAPARPLWQALTRVLAAALPGNPAFRVNAASSFYTALAAVFFALSLYRAGAALFTDTGAAVTAGSLTFRYKHIYDAASLLSAALVTLGYFLSRDILYASTSAWPGSLGLLALMAAVYSLFSGCRGRAAMLPFFIMGASLGSAPGDFLLFGATAAAALLELGGKEKKSGPVLAAAAFFALGACALLYPALKATGTAGGQSFWAGLSGLGESFSIKYGLQQESTRGLGQIAEQMKYYTTYLSSQFNLLAAGFCLAGLLIYAVTDSVRGLLLLCIFTAGGVGNLILGNPAPASYWKMNELFVPSTAVLALGFYLFSASVYRLLIKFRSYTGLEDRFTVYLPALLPLAALAFFLASNALDSPYADGSGNYFAHEYALNAASGLKNKAVLLTRGEAPYAQLVYLQKVLGTRRDIAVINTGKLADKYSLASIKSDHPGVKMPEYNANELSLEKIISDNITAIVSGNIGSVQIAFSFDTSGLMPSRYLLVREALLYFAAENAGSCWQGGPLEYHYNREFAGSGSSQAFRAAELYPSYFNYHREHALVLLQKKNYEEALGHLNIMADLQRESHEPYYLEGLIQFDKGNYDEATVLLKRAIRLGRTQAEPLVLLAQIEEKKGRQEGAFRYYQEALKADPGNTAALSYVNSANLTKAQSLMLDFFQKGLAAYNRGDLKKAVEFYTEALRINPGYFAALSNLGVCYYQMGDKATAKGIFEKILEANPQYYDVMINLGLIYYEEKNFDKTISLWEKALKFNSGNESLRKSLEAVKQNAGLLE